MSITILLLPPARGDSYMVLFFMADLPWHIINLTEQICFDLFIKLNIAIIFVYYCLNWTQTEIGQGFYTSQIVNSVLLRKSHIN